MHWGSRQPNENLKNNIAMKKKKHVAKKKKATKKKAKRA